MWNPFRRRGKDTEPPAPQAPAAPTRPAEPPAPRPGRLRRLFGRKPKPAPTAPPAAPAPAEKPPAAPAGPPSPPAEGGGGGGGEGKDYPASLPVSGTGTWKVSSTLWNGTAHGTLTGAAVRIFLDAMESGDTNTALFLIAAAYDDGSGFGEMIEPQGCSVDISYG